MKTYVNITPSEIVIKGVSTHIKMYTILSNLRDYIETKNRKLVMTFGGNPGPSGEGMCIRIVIKGEPLSETDIRAIKKFFELTRAIVNVED